MTDHADPTDDGARPRPSFYVGIGASAGGLEALQSLFSHLPSDLGAAYMIVQHLSPDFRSMMPELLSKSTDMPLKTVSDQMVVEPDTVYMLPPRKTMTLEGGVIQALGDPEGGVHLPIDIFFHSLAQDQEDKGIAIILSGTGSDGSKGLLAVKERGGLIVVQEPEDAKFDGMPHAAVSTGMADIVATAPDIAATVASYVRHPILSGERRGLRDQPSQHDSAMQEIFELLTRESDIDFAQYKTSTVSRRIEQRMGIQQLDTIEDYRRMLSVDREEAQVLARDLLIGVTRFFRDPEAFAVLGDQVIPELIADTPDGDTVRVWVVGCSTGEEAYSVAMLLKEAVADSGRRLKVKVFATDVDPEAIARASAGRFPESIADDVPPERLARHFTREADGYAVNPSLRADVVFAVHNVLKDPPFSNLRLCVCRNLLIYFQPATQRRVVQSLHFSLNLDGILFLGGSESLGEMSRYFATVDEHHKLYRRTTSAKLPINQDLVSRRDPGGGAFPVPSVSKLLRHHRDSPESTMLYRAVVEELLDTYVPPSIVIGEDHEILHVYGDISPYTTKLRSGQFKPTIESLIHDDLSIALSTALVKAGNTESNVVYRNITIRDGEDARTVDLRIGFVRERATNTSYYLVTFTDSGEVPSQPVAGIQYDEEAMSAQRIADLEGELKRHQAHLQVTVEELETTNEELQTSNEELMAANEELQSTNEELQSVNEELYTVNGEYQAKIAELSQLNADLENMITATEIGIVFLDEALAVRDFTPGAVEYVHLVRGDVGRPFAHVSHDLLYDALEGDVEQVRLDGRSIEREVSSGKGHIVLLKIQPYRLEDHQQAGVVLALTRLRNSSQRETELVDAYRELRATAGVAMLAQDRRYNVLLVDDEADDRQVFRRMMGAAKGPGDYAVHEAADAHEVFRRYPDTEFDVAFVDHRLTGEVDGLALVEVMRRRGITCPTFLLSAYLDDALYRDALRVGVYDCVDKTDLSPALLKRCVSQAIRHARTEQFLTEAGWTDADDGS